MCSDKILPVVKRHLLLANAIVWGVPGIKVLATGINSYLLLWPSESIKWLALGSIAVLAAFTWMFRFFVKKYTNRIQSFKEAKKSLLAFLPLRGWVMVVFFMCLGITLKHIPEVPTEFFASFYCGLGPALIIAGARFLREWINSPR